MHNVTHDRRFRPGREAARFETYESMLLFGILYIYFVRLISVAVKTCQTNVVFFGTSSLGDGNDVVEFDLIILQMFAAMLTCVVISSDNPHLRPERNVATCASFL